MCGQWSEEGYMRSDKDRLHHEMRLDDWKHVIDEIADHDVGGALLRGGEPFLFPGIIELIEYMHARNIFVPIDTNGTLLSKYAADIVRIGGIHLTVSVDGPEETHDTVRGVPGCFQKIRDGVAILNELEKNREEKISKAICFVISPYSVKGLGDMPDVARTLGIETIAIVPYYYIPDFVGAEYERVLKKDMGCSAFSWRGFHHDESGMDMKLFRNELKRFRENLGAIQSFPYMPLSDEQYETWFTDPLTPVGSTECANVESLIDIQPNGDADFCVDFPDYVIGNVKTDTIEDIWNGKRAEHFRKYRRNKPLPVCSRCGAKYMSEPFRK